MACAQKIKVLLAQCICIMSTFSEARAEQWASALSALASPLDSPAVGSARAASLRRPSLSLLAAAASPPPPPAAPPPPAPARAHSPQAVPLLLSQLPVEGLRGHGDALDTSSSSSGSGSPRMASVAPTAGPAGPAPAVAAAPPPPPARQPGDDHDSLVQLRREVAELRVEMATAAATSAPPPLPPPSSSLPPPLPPPSTARDEVERSIAELASERRAALGERAALQRERLLAENVAATAAAAIAELRRLIDRAQPLLEELQVAAVARAPPVAQPMLHAEPAVDDEEAAAFEQRSREAAALAAAALAEHEQAMRALAGRRHGSAR